MDFTRPPTDLQGPMDLQQFTRLITRFREKSQPHAYQTDPWIPAKA